MGCPIQLIKNATNFYFNMKYCVRQGSFISFFAYNGCVNSWLDKGFVGCGGH